MTVIRYGTELILITFPTWILYGEICNDISWEQYIYIFGNTYVINNLRLRWHQVHPFAPEYPFYNFVLTSVQ